MRGRIALAAAAVVLLLSGCAPSYSTPDERSHARGKVVSDQILAIEPQPRDVVVHGRYDGIGMSVSLGDMSFADTRSFVEQSLTIATASPLGALPIQMTFHHSSVRPARGQQLKWWGYDPARADRYYGAMQMWLDVLADTGTEFESDLTVQAVRVYGKILVFDDRDLDAYRAEIDATLTAAGYVNPGVVIEAATE